MQEIKIIELSREALESKVATKPANKVQKKWMSDIAEWAESNMSKLYSDYSDGSFQLHHVLGRSAKNNKVSIGHEFIIPVPVYLHDVDSNHNLNVTHHKHDFTDVFGMQRMLFDSMYYSMIKQGYTVPTSDIYLAIMDTNS